MKEDNRIGTVRVVPLLNRILVFSIEACGLLDVMWGKLDGLFVFIWTSWK
ncbi:MAG: hypothetical protein ACQEXB_09380 [Bacillota bacterium]